MSRDTDKAERLLDREWCGCPPCPGRGNDGHKMTHCAECCFGTGVEGDMDCPVHGAAARAAVRAQAHQPEEA